MYVDDTLVALAQTYATKEIRKLLESVYRMTDFGWPKGFLGFELVFGRDAQGNPYYSMHRTRYIKDMLDRYPVEGGPALLSCKSGADITAADRTEEAWITSFPFKNSVEALYTYSQDQIVT